MARADETTPPLGQALQRHRKAHGLSQFNLAVRMGLASAGKVSEYESGHVVPSPEMLCRYADALQLSYFQIGELFALASYIAPVRMPPIDRTRHVLNGIAQTIRFMPYPIYVGDYQTRLWLMNPACWRYYDFTRERMKLIMSRGLYITDMVYDRQLPFANGILDIDVLQRSQVLRMKATNASHLHGPHVQRMMERMQKRLSTADFAHFQGLWDGARIEDIDRAPPQQFFTIAVRGRPLRVALRSVPVLHLEQLFIENHLIPDLSDRANSDIWKQVEDETDAQTEECVSIWDAGHTYED